MKSTVCALAALVAGVLALHADALQTPAARPRGRVVLLSIDAGADWIFDDLLARGKAPAFARMAAEGARADSMVTVMPSLTAVSHASLWTGAWPRSHGISGNAVPMLPRAAHRVTETQSGFENQGLVAEPIWRTAARQGLRVFVAQATGAAPFSSEWRDRLLMFDTYSEPLLPIELIEGSIASGPFSKAIGDERLTVSAGPGGALDVALRDFHQLMTAGPAGRFSPPIRLSVNGRTGFTRLRAISYSPATGAFAILRGRVDELQSNHPERAGDLRQSAGTIVGENITRFYARGRFGPTRAEGGDGSAEALVSQIVEANHEYFTGIVALAAREPWDLLVLYVSTLDITGHALVGMIDPANPAYRREVAERVWPVMDRVVERTVDPLIASLRTRFPDATLLIGADHGMEGASRYVNTNVALRKAGLLALDQRDQIDVAKTQALQMTSMAGSIFFNSTDWKDGIVPASARAALKKAVTDAVLSLRDPDTGVMPIRAVFDAELDGEGLGIGGPAGPDLFLDTAPGYITSARLTGDAVIERMDATGSGEHGNAPWRRNLHAIFFAAGPQVSAGTNPGIVRTIDIAPTVSRLLGIDPPLNSMGRVIPLGPTTR